MVKENFLTGGVDIFRFMEYTENRVMGREKLLQNGAETFVYILLFVKKGGVQDGIDSENGINSKKGYSAYPERKTGALSAASRRRGRGRQVKLRF